MLHSILRWDSKLMPGSNALHHSSLHAISFQDPWTRAQTLAGSEFLKISIRLLGTQIPAMLHYMLALFSTVCKPLSLPAVVAFFPTTGNRRIMPTLGQRRGKGLRLGLVIHPTTKLSTNSGGIGLRSVIGRLSWISGFVCLLFHS